VRSLATILLLGCLSIAATAASFSDRSLEAGYLNPGDEQITVQEIRARGHSTDETKLNSVQIRNTGTATHQQITRIEIHDGNAEPIATVEDPAGLNTSSGITVNATHTIPANADQTLSVFVWLAGTDAVSGGETVALGVRFHYIRGGSAGSSAWISDGEPEEIKKAGFEEITDNSPDPFNMNPQDRAVVHVASFRDNDANDSDITVERITLENTGSATATDIARFRAVITYDGDEYAAEDDWQDDGVELEPNDFGWDGKVDDQGEIVIELRLDAAGRDDITDGRTIRTRITLELLENEEGFEQRATSPSTHTIRRTGLEVVKDDSSVPSSRIVNPGESVTQRVIGRDDDVNEMDVVVTAVKVRNLGTADAGDLERITVSSGGRSAEFTGGALTGVKTGVTLDISGIPEDRRTVEDDDERVFTIRYRVAGNMEEGRTLQPEVQLVNVERGNEYTSRPATYPESVELRKAGFEFVEDLELDEETYFSGQRFLAQKIRVEDRDENDNSVVINPVTVRNTGSAPDAAIAKIEVRTAAGDLMGETTDVDGFSAGGTTISTLQNNVVGDNSSAKLGIWITLAGPEDTKDEATVRTETTIRHTEAGQSHHRTILAGTTFTTEANHPPEVEFSFSPAEPDWDEEITFEVTKAEDPDNDDIVEFEWDFGDGTVIERDEPVDVTHTYRTGGTFEVTLTATDERGMAGSYSATVEVEGPPDLSPEVDFSWEPEEPETDEEVSFTSEVTDPADPPLEPYEYAWDFGDGNASDEANPTHSYDSADTYTVELVVTNEAGDTGTATHTITVVPKPTPAPTLGQLAVSPGVPEAGQDVTFSIPTDAPDDDPATEWEWEFGDDNDAVTTDNETTHTYEQAGFYTVRVRARNEEGGWSGWREREITVRQEGAELIVTRLAENPVETQAIVEIFAPEGATDMRIYIFDMLGREVHSEQLDGDEARWELTDDRDRLVSSGVYFYLITARLGENNTIRSETGRIMVVR